jgi:cell wall-associated NlpC family hydrolase
MYTDRSNKRNVSWLIIALIYSGLLIIPPLINGTSEKNLPKGIRMEIVNDAIKFKGTNRNNFDCSDFTRYIYKIHGILLPATAKKQYSDASNILSRDDAEEGDLIFFKINSEKISHVGIYIGNSRFIHSPGKNKVVRIDSLDEYWKNRLAGFRTFFPDN